MKAGFFEDSEGNKSSSRALGFIVTLYALLLATGVVVSGYIQNTPTMLLATAAGTIFTTIAGPAMYFMFNNKKVENKIDDNKTNDNKAPIND